MCWVNSPIILNFFGASLYREVMNIICKRTQRKISYHKGNGPFLFLAKNRIFQNMPIFHHKILSFKKFFWLRISIFLQIIYLLWELAKYSVVTKSRLHHNPKGCLATTQKFTNIFRVASNLQTTDGLQIFNEVQFHQGILKTNISTQSNQSCTDYVLHSPFTFFVLSLF